MEGDGLLAVAGVLDPRFKKTIKMTFLLNCFILHQPVQPQLVAHVGHPVRLAVGRPHLRHAAAIALLVVRPVVTDLPSKQKTSFGHKRNKLSLIDSVRLRCKQGFFFQR